MTLQCMLDDGQAEPGSAQLARSARIDPVEPLGESWNMLGRDANAGVCYRDVAASIVDPPADADATLPAACISPRWK